jgi:hypothetical protein
MTIHPAVKKALLLLLTLVLAAMGVTATTAAISSEGSSSPDALLKVQPPPPQQGGTCLSGYIIDRYYQPAGAGWTVQITSSEGHTQSQRPTRRQPV